MVHREDERGSQKSGEEEPASISYEDAGVDIEEGERAVERMREHVDSTARPGVMGSIGGFGGLFDLEEAADQSQFHPWQGGRILAASTDGVGTKLKVAFRMDKHDTVGIDCVAMVVNDILATGAEPLFFLDYLATGELHAEQAAEVVSGVAAGCRQARCALLGGETAEMPDFYPPGEYDLVGFGVGVVDKDHMLTPQALAEGDLLLGLPSSGLHSNGYSLVRRIAFQREKMDVGDHVPEFGRTLGEEMLEPTIIYVNPVLDLLQRGWVKGVANITGGGLGGNVRRILPSSLAARIDLNSWEVPPIFHWIAERGPVAEQEMRATFNLGLGMVIVTAEKDADNVLAQCRERGVEAKTVGKIVGGKGEVVFEGSAF